MSLLLATHHGFFGDRVRGAGAALGDSASGRHREQRAAQAARPGAGFTIGSRSCQDSKACGNHLALANDNEHNAPEGQIANLEPSQDCKGHAIRVDRQRRWPLRGDQHRGTASLAPIALADTLQGRPWLTTAWAVPLADCGDHRAGRGCAAGTAAGAGPKSALADRADAVAASRRGCSIRTCASRATVPPH